RADVVRRLDQNLDRAAAVWRLDQNLDRTAVVRWLDQRFGCAGVVQWPDQKLGRADVVQWPDQNRGRAGVVRRPDQELGGAAVEWSDQNRGRAHVVRWMDQSRGRPDAVQWPDQECGCANVVQWLDRLSGCQELVQSPDQCGNLLSGYRNRFGIEATRAGRMVGPNPQRGGTGPATGPRGKDHDRHVLPSCLPIGDRTGTPRAGRRVCCNESGGRAFSADKSAPAERSSCCEGRPAGAGLLFRRDRALWLGAEVGR